MSHPTPKILLSPWWSLLPHLLVLLLRLAPHIFILLTIFSNLSPCSDISSNGFHIQRDPVFERLEVLWIFMYMNLICLISMIRGYRSVKVSFLAPFDDEEKDAESSTAAELRVLLQGRYHDFRKGFAEYVANPFPSFPSPSRFSRREQAYSFSTHIVLNLTLARLPFREWSKMDDMIPSSLDLFFQVLGMGVVVAWVWFMVKNALWEGWSAKLGGVAREIRRECLRVGCIEGGFEQGGGEGEARERLEWWIAEVLREDDDNNTEERALIAQA